MFKLNRTTRKFYYEDPWLAQCQARVVRVGDACIELDATVAYPEGGGQESDIGVIVAENGNSVGFVHAKKVYGNALLLADFPDIQVDGIIEHMINPGDADLLREIKVGQQVLISIDTRRRAQLSLSHTASHLLYLGVAEVRSDAVAATLGCHIKTDGARFDFGVETRFSPEELAEIERIANEYVDRDSAISVYSHAEHYDARYWECEGRIIPCGGTHLDSTRSIGTISVRRKSLGKGKERISCTFEQSQADTSRFHA